MMTSEKFGGDKKVRKAFTTDIERRFINFAVPRIPSWIRTYQLTLLTIPISVCILLFSYLAHFEIKWLWIVSCLIALQWLTDSLDGTLGKVRGEGLVRWGYYMDHLLDYFFLAAILIGYIIISPDENKHFHFFILAIFGGFMAHSFLGFAATNQFRVTFLGIGPTEIRIGFILINTLLIIFGKQYFIWLVPYVLVGAFVILCMLVYQTQKNIWNIDMINRK